MERLLIIGGVAAGPTAAARARRCCPEAEVVVYDQGRFVSYAGCGMPYFIGGVTGDHRSLVARTPEQFRARNGVEVLTRHRAEKIDPVNKRVRVRDLEGGSEFWSSYSRLLLSTGASPFVPSIPGTDLSGVFTLRSLEDSLAIRDFLKSARPRRAVIVGAGPIGMEMCEAFSAAGLEVAVVEMAETVMPLLDPEISSLVRSHLEARGVTCLTGGSVTSLEGDGEGSVRRVVTSSEELEAEIVLLAIGIRPVTDIAVDAGVELGTRGAIRVDAGLRTNLPDIFAAGDCATTRNSVTSEETWIPLGSTSRKQGRLAADNIFGAGLEFPGVQGTSVVKVFDLTAGRTGLGETEAQNSGFETESITFEAEAVPKYYGHTGTITMKLVAERPTGRVLGAQVAGDVPAVAEKRLDVLAVAVAARFTSSDLQYLDLAYAPPYSTAVDVPIVAGNLMTAKISGKPCTCDSEGLEG